MDKINQSGWLKAKIDETRTANATTTESENGANIRHYENAYKAKHGTPAPPAVLLFTASRDSEGTNYFLKASNMPMTQTIYENRLTPYYNKQKDDSDEATPDERGFGAVLPILYTGGEAHFQYLNENGVMAEVVSDVEAQKTDAIDSKSELSRPIYKPKIVGRGAHYYKDADLWGTACMELFEQYNICTWETHVSPTFNGKEDFVGKRAHFENFLEGLQAQFEQQIIEGSLILLGVWATESKETPFIYKAPFTFYRHRPEFKDLISFNPQILTSCGRYNLDDSMEVGVQIVSTGTDSYVRARFTDKQGQASFYEWKAIGGNNSYDSIRLDIPATQFTQDYSLVIGRSDMANRYAQILNNLSEEDRHPQKYPLIENHNYGAYVSASGIRLSLAPLSVDNLRQPKHYMDGNKIRIFVDLKTKAAKKYVHFKDWKEKSEFYRGKNMIVFGINAMICFLQKAFENSKSSKWTEDKFIDVLNGKKAEVQKRKIKVHAGRGKITEINFGSVMRTALPFVETIVDDKFIKTQILGQLANSEGNQAIDTLHRTEGLWIGTQIKRTERDKPEDFANFVNTFHTLRTKAREKKALCYGVLVHYGGLKQDAIKNMLLKEPGISVMSRDLESESIEEFEQRCVAHFKEIFYFYGPEL
jgi:hypothetical protein